MKIFFIFGGLLLSFSALHGLGKEEVPHDTARQIFIYETLRDYDPAQSYDVENAIEKSFLENDQKKELLEALERQCKRISGLQMEILFPLLHRSIPSDYAMGEIVKLYKDGTIGKGVFDFIKRAQLAGFSLDGTLEFVRESIRKDRDKSLVLENLLP